VLAAVAGSRTLAVAPPAARRAVLRAVSLAGDGTNARPNVRPVGLPSSDVLGVVGAAEEVGVGSGVGDGDGVGDGVGLGVGDGVVGSGDGDGDAGGEDEECDRVGRGELDCDECDEAGELPCCGESEPPAGLVDEECLPGDGLAADTLVLAGCVGAGAAPCNPAVGRNPFWAPKCSSRRTAPAPSATTVTAAAPAANTRVPRGRTARGLARPGELSGPNGPSRSMTSAR
jgi:hypothetical protein